MSFFPFYQVDMTDDETIVKSIREINEVISTSTLGQEGKAFAHGTMFTYWSAFLHMEPLLWRILGISLAVVFGVTLVLLESPLAALACGVSCAMIVLELYGICMLFLKFNVFI